MKLRRVLLGFAVFSAIFAQVYSVARAEDESAESVEEDATQNIQVHGSVSQGFILSTGNNYLGETKRGTFRFTEAGLNFTKALDHHLKAGFQLFARTLGASGNFYARFDWFYLDYRPENWLGIRAGRVKIPFGLFNETSDIDAARVPILLPGSMYPPTNRDFLLAQNGAEVYGLVDLDGGGQLEYSLYGGTINIDLPSNNRGALVQISSIDVPYLAGARVVWDTPIEGLRAGTSFQALRLDFSFVLAGVTSSADISALLAAQSIEYTKDDLHLAAEYSLWNTFTDGSGALFPASNVTAARMYAMGDYRLTSYLRPGLYYARTVPNVRELDGVEDQLHDVALTLCFDINKYWIFKLEGHYLNGTAGLDTTLNDNIALSSLERSWGLWLAKTTLFF